MKKCFYLISRKNRTEWNGAEQKGDKEGRRVKKYSIFRNGAERKRDKEGGGEIK